MGYPEGDPKDRANVLAFQEGLRGVGRDEGRNIQIDYDGLVWTSTGRERLPKN